jgi:DNA topoisomerase-1
MAKKVVIVESGAKAKTISRYLGKGFEVKASRGHVRDLPEDEFGVDVANGFEPTYRVLPDSERIVGQLRAATRKAEEVYLAPDPDREGEAIAWHLKHALDLPDEKVQRVTFNEITREAVREAFAHPRGIDLNLVDAQQARRILDRLVGYELSPLVSRKIVRGLSAGRVQSVALRIIVERERERDAFQLREYWEIRAVLSRPGEQATFEAELKKLDGQDAEVPDEARASQLVELLRGQRYCVASVQTRMSSSKAPPPFITSTLQQAANSRLNLTTAQTMRLAQQLYEGVDIGTETAGLITYMRTDSTRVADQAVGSCRGLIAQAYGQRYLPAKPNVFPNPKGAQAAHEAIRPTDVTRRPQDLKRYLSPKQLQLYELVWQRFVASQMVPARYEVTDVGVEAGPALFQARGRRTVFDGYTRVGASGDEGKDQTLPELSVGEELTLKDLAPSQHFTQPPPRYTEATLVKELERQGIGRPSTYAPTISTLLRRNYVRRMRRALAPTDLGMVVTDLLVKHFQREMDVSFTSTMEAQLDEIEEGKRNWRSTLQEFYSQFSRDLEKARAEMQAAPPDQETRPCPECGKPLALRFSRKGDSFWGCTGFPECKHTAPAGRKESEQPVETEYACDKCGAPMLLRTGKRGREYLACSAFPACRNIMGLDREGRPVKLKSRLPTAFSCARCGGEMHVEEEGAAGELTCARCRSTTLMLTVREALQATDLPEGGPSARCAKCGGPMQFKRSRKGLFLGCADYPACKGTTPVPKDLLPAPQPTRERCEKCGRPLVMRWGQYGRFLACSGFPRCRNLWKVSERRDPCPRPDCGGELMRKTSARGEDYLGCTRFPECDHREPAPPRKKPAGKGAAAKPGAAKPGRSRKPSARAPRRTRPKASAGPSEERQ